MILELLFQYLCAFILGGRLVEMGKCFWLILSPPSVAVGLLEMLAVHVRTLEKQVVHRLLFSSNTAIN